MCIRDRPTPAAQPITLQNARRSPHPRFQPMTRRNRRRGTACGASGLSQAPTDVSQEPQKLYEAFGRSTMYKTMRSRRTRCVTIDYVGDFHVDVVPFVTRYGSTHVTNRSTDEFEVAAPDDFTEWLEAKNRITSGNLVKVVRLLKYLRDHKTRYTIPSVTLTAALAHHVSETTKILDPDAYKNVANTLQTLSEELAAQIADYPTSPPYIRDPGTGQDLTDRWEAHNYRTFRTRFTSYAGSIIEACEETDYSRALTIWRNLF